MFVGDKKLTKYSDTRKYLKCLYMYYSGRDFCFAEPFESDVNGTFPRPNEYLKTYTGYSKDLNPYWTNLYRYDRTWGGGVP